MAPGSPEPPLRTYVSAGLLAAGIALVLAHGYRAIYLAAGGTSFAEIGAVSTTLAAVVPVLLAALAYRLARRWLGGRARVAFTTGVLTLGIASTIPFVLAPLHPGFAALSVPLHVLVASTAAFVIPAWVARSAAPAAPEPENAAEL